MPGVCECARGECVESCAGGVLLCARGVWLCAKGGVWLCDGLCARGRVELCARGRSGCVPGGGLAGQRGGGRLVLCRGGIWLEAGGVGCVPEGGC